MLIINITLFLLRSGLQYLGSSQKSLFIIERRTR